MNTNPADNKTNNKIVLDNNNKTKPVSFHFSKTIRQFITFAGVGVVGTAGHYIVLLILVQGFFLNPVIATTAGFIVGAIINYHLNYKYTFKSNKNHTEAITKFFIIAIIGGLLNSYLMHIGLRLTSLNYFIIQILATCSVLIINFSFNKIWTFSEK